MQIRITLDHHMPIHVQLKEQLKFLILNGDVKAGAELPTTRQLAGFLCINRNTVHRAYQELAREGLIECRQGRGCVVLERPVSAARPILAQLLKMVDHAIEQAVELGVSYDDFATLVYARSRQRRNLQAGQRLMFVECETLIVTGMAQAIREKLDVDVIPVVLRDLRQPTPEIEAQLREVCVVVTTFFHVQEVKRLLSGSGRGIVAVGVKPHLENLFQVTRIPPGTPVALVCVSEYGALDLKQSLENAGIGGLKTTLCGTDDMQKLAETLPGFPVVIASDFVASEVQPLIQPGQELITLDYTTLDEGAISLLRSLMSESSQGASDFQLREEQNKKGTDFGRDAQ